MCNTVDACERLRIKVEATDMDIIEEEISVIKVEEDAFMDIKEEETSSLKFEEVLVDTKPDFPGDANSPTIKAEQDQVSYICVFTLLDTV
jgi:hypothetical protein